MSGGKSVNEGSGRGGRGAPSPRGDAGMRAASQKAKAAPYPPQWDQGASRRSQGFFPLIHWTEGRLQSNAVLALFLETSHSLPVNLCKRIVLFANLIYLCLKAEGGW